MIENKEYLLLEINKSEEKEIREWLKEKKLQVAPVNNKGIALMEENIRKYKIDVNQNLMEIFIYSLLLPMGKESPEGLIATIIAKEPYEDEYECEDLTLNDKELECEIKNFYNVDSILELFKEQDLDLYEDYFEEMNDEEKQKVGYGERGDYERMVTDYFEIPKYETIKIF